MLGLINLTLNNAIKYNDKKVKKTAKSVHVFKKEERARKKNTKKTTKGLR